MEFIEKLYSNELFAPILFTIVGILALLFVIVLILALRDAKKSKNVVEVAYASDDEKEEAIVNENELKEETIEKEEIKEEKENVIDNIVPESDSFEEIQIDAPEEKEETEKIKIENEEVASIELERAENDLDEIAATLLKEYQKEKDDDEEVIETPQVSDKQISSVFVSPDTLPVKEEESKMDLPSLSDIPLPQPVRVVQSSQIIDSSKKENVSINDIETEEYSIKR